MSLGEQFKQLRSECNFSQPELAERMGIEQSYLSKLENDKSIPSNEVFREFLKAVNLNLEQFLSRFNLAQDRLQLMQILDIEQRLNQQFQQKVFRQRRYLYCCSTLIVVSVTLFYMGFSKLVFSERSWEYQSPGIVLQGEPIDFFSSYRNIKTLQNGKISVKK